MTNYKAVALIEFTHCYLPYFQSSPYLHSSTPASHSLVYSDKCPATVPDFESVFCC